MPQNVPYKMCWLALPAILTLTNILGNVKQTLKRIVRRQWGRHLLTGRYKCFQITSFERCLSRLTTIRKHPLNWKIILHMLEFSDGVRVPTTTDIFWFEGWLRADAFLKFCICQLFVSSNEPFRHYSLTVTASKTHMPQIPHTCRVQTEVGCQNLKPIINRKFSAGAQSVVDRIASAKCKLPQCLCRICMHSCRVASISDGIHKFACICAFIKKK